MDLHWYENNQSKLSNEIMISIPCLLHKNITTSFSIKKCSYKYYKRCWCHVIYLSEPKELQTPLNSIKSIAYKYNESNKVSEIWEYLNAKPLCSMNSLDHDCSSNILKLLISKLVECICQLTLNEIVIQTLIHGKKNPEENAKNFLSNIATVGETENNFTFYLLNRFTLESVKNLPNKKTKVRFLKKQLLMIHSLIKCFYFRKKNEYDKTSRKYSKLKMTQFCKDCTLTGYISYYTYANIQELHKHFCIMNKNANKMQGLLNMSTNISILYQAIQFVTQLEANVTPIKHH